MPWAISFEGTGTRFRTDNPSGPYRACPDCLLTKTGLSIEANVYLTHESQERIDPPLKKGYSCVYLKHKGGSHDKEWHDEYHT